MYKNLVKVGMPIFEGKKVLNVGVKVNETLRQELERIAVKEDRPMSYIVRELAIRGLALYKKDGLLKLTKDEEKAFNPKNGKSEQSREEIERDYKLKQAVVKPLHANHEPFVSQGEAHTDLKPRKNKKTG